MCVFYNALLCKHAKRDERSLCYSTCLSACVCVCVHDWRFFLNHAFLYYYPYYYLFGEIYSISRMNIENVFVLHQDMVFVL